LAIAFLGGILYLGVSAGGQYGDFTREFGRRATSRPGRSASASTP